PAIAIAPPPAVVARRAIRSSLGSRFSCGRGGFVLALAISSVLEHLAGFQQFLIRILVERRGRFGRWHGGSGFADFFAPRVFFGFFAGDLGLHGLDRVVRRRDRRLPRRRAVATHLLPPASSQTAFLTGRQATEGIVLRRPAFRGRRLRRPLRSMLRM